MDELKQQIEALKELVAIQKQTIETLKSTPKVIYTPYYIYQPYQYTYGAQGISTGGAGYASGVLASSGQFGK